MVEVIIQEDKCYNFHIIINANGAKIGHIARMQPMALKKMSLCFEVRLFQQITLYIITVFWGDSKKVSIYPASIAAKVFVVVHVSLTFQTFK